jgi:hypothetical protein
MFHYSNVIALCCCLFSGISGAVFSQDALDRSEQIVAAAKAADPSIPRKGLPTKFEDPSSLFALKEADFAAMMPSDERLKAAWVDLLCGVPNGFPRGLRRDSPEVAEALKGPNPNRVHVFFDLQRRGNSATPHLIQLATELAETDFEASVIGLMPTLPGIEVAPYVEYCRKLLRERPRSTQIIYAAMLLSRHGSQEDISLIDKVAASRPFFRDSLQKSSTLLRSRLGSTPPTGSSPSGEGVTSQNQPMGSANHALETKPTTSTPSEEPTSSTPWSVVAVLIVAATGLLWLLVKKRK